MDLLGCAKGMVTAWGVAGERLDAEHAERGRLSSDLGGEPILCRGSWAEPPAWGPWPGTAGHVPRQPGGGEADAGCLWAWR